MPIERVAPDDPRVAPYRDLKARARDASRDPGRFVVEGELAVRRLLESGFAIESLLGEPARLAKLAALRPGLPLLGVDDDDLTAITGVALHRGLVALARRPTAFARPALDRP